MRLSCVRGVVRDAPARRDGRAFMRTDSQRSHSEYKSRESDAGRSQSAGVAAARGWARLVGAPLVLAAGGYAPFGGERERGNGSSPGAEGQQC